jgi:hypothetical protein
MAIYKKSVSKPVPAANPDPPRTAADNKRTFDMRPKPTDYKRHDEPQYRAPKHPDVELDNPQDGDSKE